MFVKPVLPVPLLNMNLSNLCPKLSVLTSFFFNILRTLPKSPTWGFAEVYLFHHDHICLFVFTSGAWYRCRQVYAIIVIELNLHLQACVNLGRNFFSQSKKPYHFSSPLCLRRQSGASGQLREQNVFVRLLNPDTVYTSLGQPLYDPGQASVSLCDSDPVSVSLCNPELVLTTQGQFAPPWPSLLVSLCNPDPFSFPVQSGPNLFPLRPWIKPSLQPSASLYYPGPISVQFWASVCMTLDLCVCTYHPGPVSVFTISRNLLCLEGRRLIRFCLAGLHHQNVFGSNTVSSEADESSFSFVSFQSFRKRSTVWPRTSN